MELQIDNMLEVAEIITALEQRIEFNRDITKNEISLEACMKIYDQVKIIYDDYLNFKY